MHAGGLQELLVIPRTHSPIQSLVPDLYGDAGLQHTRKTGSAPQGSIGRKESPAKSERQEELWYQLARSLSLTDPKASSFLVHEMESRSLASRGGPTQLGHGAAASLLLRDLIHLELLVHPRPATSDTRDIKSPEQQTNPSSS